MSEKSGERASAGPAAVQVLEFQELLKDSGWLWSYRAWGGGLKRWGSSRLEGSRGGIESAETRRFKNKD